MSMRMLTIRLTHPDFETLSKQATDRGTSVTELFRQMVRERLEVDHTIETIERVGREALAKLASENKAALDHIEGQLAAVVTALAAARPAPAAPVPGRLQSPDLIRDTSRKS